MEPFINFNPKKDLIPTGVDYDSKNNQSQETSNDIEVIINAKPKEPEKEHYLWNYLC